MQTHIFPYKRKVKKKKKVKQINQKREIDGVWRLLWDAHRRRGCKDGGKD